MPARKSAPNHLWVWTRILFGLITLCRFRILGLSVAASYIGVAAIIGAFLAGMTMAEAAENTPKMHRQMSGVTEFLVPFFLVNISMKLNLDVFRSSSVIILCALITLVGIVTRFLGCGPGALNLGVRRAAQVGMGMVPRGEVGIIVAQIGLSLAVIGPEIYGVVLFMAVATTVIAPPFLKLLYASEAAAHEEIGPPDAGGDRGFRRSVQDWLKTQKESALPANPSLNDQSVRIGANLR